MGEFELIRRYFARADRAAHLGVPLGIGDDCALLSVAPGMTLAVSSDMLVEGRHFLPTVDAASLGHKALAVNLSDLAAMGAKPLGFTLALALPQADEPWLAGFSQGLFELADAHGCALVGGDTTRGPLNICITVFGEVPAGQALLRSGAKAGDELWVSGYLGDARLALEVFRGKLNLDAAAFAMARDRLERPSPRVALGLGLRGLASAAIDISDGLLGDLSHLLTASAAGARIGLDKASNLIAELPLNSSQNRVISEEQRMEFVLAGGDDYELAFTAQPQHHAQVLAAAAAANTRVTCVGQLEHEPGIRLHHRDGTITGAAALGFDHFA